MIDIQFIRDNAELVQEKSKQKGVTVDTKALLELDHDHRELLGQVEDLRRKRNENAEVIKKAGKPGPELIDIGKQIKLELSEREGYLSATEEKLNILLKQVPNMPLDDVPVGSSEDDNVVVRSEGELPDFDFEPKNHWQLAEARGWIDKERAAKVAGARFAYIKGDLVRLHFALMTWAMDILGDEETLARIAKAAGLNVSSKPFTPVLPPLMVRTEVYEATGRLDKEEQTYKLADEDAWMNASAEHALCPMYQDEILPKQDLPIRYVGYATSFRREAGTYGKDMEGILRMHQFEKLEMESFTTAEDSLNEHLFLIAIQEYLMQQLGLPYQVVMKCTADIGGPNARGVDIDTWLPGQGSYRETHTADLITDYQTRRLKTRVRGEDGSLSFAHTNDATALSMRPMIAILENYQNSDGTVRIPEVIQNYMGGKQIL